MPGSQEVPLAGGTTPGVMRVGDTVRRPRTRRSAAVEALLVHLEAAEIGPRFLGVDECGRQVWEYVDGEVPAGPPYDIGDKRLTSAMRLVRRFHDATAGTPWAAGHEVVCHGDLGPHNTVFRGDAAVRLLDWDDDVRGGRRIADVADAAWGYGDLVGDSVPIAEQARRLELACSAYGGVTPREVAEELLGYFERARRRHLAAGRQRAVAVFDGLIASLRAQRQELTGSRPSST